MKKTEAKKLTPQRTIDQLSFARLIAQKLNLKLVDVMTVIEEEQKLTMEYVRLGYKVIKKNYLTIQSRSYQGKEKWKNYNCIFVNLKTHFAIQLYKYKDKIPVEIKDLEKLHPIVQEKLKKT